MKKLFFLLLMGSSFPSLSQLYTPNGTIAAPTSNPATGNVGIGTSSPSSLLHLKNTTSNVINLSFSTAYNGGSLRYTATSGDISNQRLAFTMGGGYELFSMLNDGKISTYSSPHVGTFNVGTPVNSNSMTLGSASGVGFSNTISGLYGLYMGVSGTGRTWIQGGRSDGQAIAYDISLQAAGGNVGIGTTSPSSRLDVSDSKFDLSIVALRNSNWACNQRTAIEFWNGGNKNFATSRIVSQMDGCGAGGEALSFETQTAGTTSPSVKLIIKNDGNVGIGTTNPNQKLTVNGTIYGKEVKVDLNVPGPDYVFADNYQLQPLTELKTYIDQNKHLPEVPSAAAMEANGINLGEMNMLLLKKVEELTLYMLEKDDEIRSLRLDIEKLTKRNNEN